MSGRALLRAAAFLLLIGCGLERAKAPEPTAPPPAPASLEEEEEEEMLPTPYTAAQIREAMPVGTRLRLLIEAMGRPTVISDWEVTASDGAGVKIHYLTLAEDGATELEPRADGSYGWEELRSHALYAASNTIRAEGTSVVTPLGTLQTVLYTQTLTEGDTTTVNAYHFAVDIPGPPVDSRTFVNGEQVLAMTMVQRSGFPR